MACHVWLQTYGPSVGSVLAVVCVVQDDATIRAGGCVALVAVYGRCAVVVVDLVANVVV